MEHLSPEDVAAQLHELIRDADCDTLAALYEYAFGAVESCMVIEDDEDETYLEVQYHPGLEPF